MSSSASVARADVHSEPDIRSTIPCQSWNFCRSWTHPQIVYERDTTLGFGSVAFCLWVFLFCFFFFIFFFGFHVLRVEWVQAQHETSHSALVPGWRWDVCSHSKKKSLRLLLPSLLQITGFMRYATCSRIHQPQGGFEVIPNSHYSLEQQESQGGALFRLKRRVVFLKNTDIQYTLTCYSRSRADFPLNRTTAGRWGNP